MPHYVYCTLLFMGQSVFRNIYKAEGNGRRREGGIIWQSSPYRQTRCLLDHQSTISHFTLFFFFFFILLIKANENCCDLGRVFVYVGVICLAVCAMTCWCFTNFTCGSKQSKKWLIRVEKKKLCGMSREEGGGGKEEWVFLYKLSDLGNTFCISHIGRYCQSSWLAVPLFQPNSTSRLMDILY